MKNFKKPLIMSGVFVVGFLLGCMLMGVMAMNAGRTFLRMESANYRQEQELLGDQCLRHGNLTRAWLHYDNVVQILSAGDARAFNLRPTVWPLSFPVTALILNKMECRTDSSGRGRALEEGISRGKLALALEKQGRSGEARLEYLRAARAMGMGDNEIGRVKQLVEEVLSARG